MKTEYLRRLSAQDVEEQYDNARLSKKDVTQWVRLSAKLSGEATI